MCRSVSIGTRADRDRERTENFTADRATTRGADEHSGVHVGNHLDEAGISSLVDPPRDDEAVVVNPTATFRPSRRACSSLSPTDPTSGSVKVTRDSAA